MHMKNKDFILNQKRDFGNIISDGFTFVKRTFKLQGEFFLLLVLPVLLFAIFSMYFVFSDLSAEVLIEQGSFSLFQTGKFILAYGGLIIAFLLFYYIIYSIAIQYEQNGNQVPEKEAVTRYMRENAGRYLLYFFVVIVLIIAIAALAFMFFFASPVIGGLVIFLLAIAAFFFVPYFSIFPIVYLRERKGLVEAMQDTIRLIKGNWWPTFGVVFITNIIGSFASYVFIIPIYILMIINMFGTGDNPANTGDDLGFYMSLMMIVSMLSGVIILTYTTSAILLKYFDLKERKDNVSIFDKIDQIGESESSIFENEGDY